ncbi:MAG TPA: heme lyase CcmF/NrfE family subunit [Gammaproteobacteria bacterium]|nr:heme lyase CcmF/NrfE family subunit [Gammaproteobacteria bacterium]
MIPEIGNFALILALCVALVQGVVSIAGAQLGIRSWMELARPSAQAYFVFVAVAFGCLTYSFIVSDFSVKYVASVSNSMLPLQYRIAAVWGGHEGSLLLWALLLGVWTLAVSRYSRNLPLEMVSRVIGVMGLISVGFLLFTLFTSNPFDRLLPAALDGRDLNPLLQDPGLIIHPPLLYIGYVGFSVAFAFAIAALLGGHMDATWARWSRPWTTVAWVFLTLGISLGSWWAYYELGWGGWWFWDPVENASFMPWLVGTALVHSLAVTEKRGGFKNWTVLLAILAFSLSLLGTFLVRSGVLTSVHAFATDPERGVFILGFLVVVIGGSLALYAWRAPKVGLGGRFQLVSRETFLLTNNVLLVVACGAVLLGTLYPLLLDSLDLGKISVGPPYFDAVFLPLMVPLIFLMGVGPMARWKQASIPDMADRLRWAGVVSVVMALILPFVMGKWSALASLGFALTFWVFACSVVNIRERMAATRANSKAGLLRRIIGLPRAYLGMHAAHIGMGVFIMGVTMVNTYEVEKDMRMDIGDTVTMGGHTFRFDGVTQIEGPNYNASRGQILVSKDGKPVTVLFPEKRTYLVQTMPMTEAAIDTGLFRDLYVSLGEPVSNGAWSVRVYYKPFVSWIWGGTAIMALGGLLAVSDRRYRITARRRKETRVKTATSGARLATEEK